MDVQGGYIILLMMGLPILFFVIVWALGTALRLTAPEQPLPFRADPVALRRRLTTSGHTVPVGVREIREDQRWKCQEEVPVDYEYEGLPRHRIPSQWQADLDLRRN